MSSFSWAILSLGSEANKLSNNNVKKGEQKDSPSELKIVDMMSLGKLMTWVAVDMFLFFFFLNLKLPGCLNKQPLKTLSVWFFLDKDVYITNNKFSKNSWCFLGVCLLKETTGIIRKKTHQPKQQQRVGDDETLRPNERS